MLTCSKCVLSTQKDYQRQVSPGWLAVEITHLYLTTCCKPPGVHSAPRTQHTWKYTTRWLGNSSFLFCLGLLRLRSPFPPMSIWAEGSDVKEGEGGEKQTAHSGFFAPHLLGSGFTLPGQVILLSKQTLALIRHCGRLLRYPSRWRCTSAELSKEDLC